MFAGTTTRCTLSGESCFEPVLGNWELVGVFFLACIVWSFKVWCCNSLCRDDMCDELCTTEEEAEQVRQSGGDGRQYQRMSEVVEMR